MIAIMLKSKRRLWLQGVHAWLCSWAIGFAAPLLLCYERITGQARYLERPAIGDAVTIAALLDVRNKAG